MFSKWCWKSYGSEFKSKSGEAHIPAIADFGGPCLSIKKGVIVEAGGINCQGKDHAVKLLIWWWGKLRQESSISGQRWDPSFTWGIMPLLM